GSVQRVGLAALDCLGLDVPDRFIAEIADQPAAEAQRRGNRRDLLAREIAAQVRKGVRGLETLDHDVRAARIAEQPPDIVTAYLDAFRAGKADERITAETLAADHRLEQIAEGNVR